MIGSTKNITADDFEASLKLFHQRSKKTSLGVPRKPTRKQLNQKWVIKKQKKSLQIKAVPE